MKRLILAFRVAIEGSIGVFLLINLATSIAESIARKSVRAAPAVLLLLVWAVLVIASSLIWDAFRLGRKLEQNAPAARLMSRVLRPGYRRLAFEIGLGLFFLSFSVAGVCSTLALVLGQPPDPFAELGAVYEDGYPPGYSFHSERWKLVGDTAAIALSGALLWHARHLRETVKLAENVIVESLQP